MRFLLFTILAFASSGDVQAIHHSSKVTLPSEDRLTIFQIGDDVSLWKFKAWTRTVDNYAREHGARHSLVSETARPLVDSRCGSRGQHGCFISKKPEYIMREMDDMGSNTSWLVYLDLDIAIANPDALSNSKLDNMTSRRASINNSMRTLGRYLDSLGADCEFVAQDSHHTVNSGFLAFKGPFGSTSGSLSRNLIDLWKEETDRIQPWGSWVGDQGPLQSALLKLAAQTRTQRRLLYNNSCDMETNSSSARNVCWNHVMTQLNLPFNNRSFGKYCLLSAGHRWNMHDSGDVFQLGDTFYHGKDRKVVESITQGIPIKVVTTVPGAQ